MTFLKVFLIIYSVRWVSSTIASLTYRDPFIPIPLKKPPPGYDPCNPLYWYPKQIPEYCYMKLPPPPPMPMPIPLPLPVPAPAPVPMPPAPPVPAYPSVPLPMFPPPIPLPYGVPLIPSDPMLPVAGVRGYPYNPIPQYPNPMVGMMPGLPGLVTRDGGVNILPFSDAYADILENHKRRMMRKKMKKILDEYADNPKRRRHRH